MKERTQELLDRCRQHPIVKSIAQHPFARWCHRRLVLLATRKYVLQGLVVGAIFFIIQLTARNVAFSINAALQWLTGYSPPVETTLLLLMLSAVALALWIDSRSERLREWVSEASGDDDAE